jgi:type I restriction enzyme S subunit
MAVFRTTYFHFVYHQFQTDFIKRQIHEHLGATIDQITNKSLNSFQIPFPVDENEQTAIAAVLSDMDAEIATLERRRDKTHALK